MSRIKWFSCGVLAGVLTGASALPAIAQPMFENWNTAACGFTDVATLAVDQPTHLDRVEFWYKWGPNETAVAYTALRDGQVVFSGNMVRAECDPYQRAWCVARDEPAMDLAPGVYTFRTPRAAICQNAGSRGEGMLRAFGSEATTPPDVSAPPEQPPSEEQPSAEAPLEPAPSGSGVFVPTTPPVAAPPVVTMPPAGAQAPVDTAPPTIPPLPAGAMSR